jgi:hypothetical protein
MAEVDVGLMLLAFVFAAIIYFFIVSKRYRLKDWTNVYGNVERNDLKNLLL